MKWIIDVFIDPPQRPHPRPFSREYVKEGKRGEDYWRGVLGVEASTPQHLGFERERRWRTRDDTVGDGDDRSPARPLPGRAGLMLVVGHPNIPPGGMT